MQYFRDQGIIEPHPRDHFDNDLISFRTKSSNIGDNVILGTDTNKDTRYEKLAKLLSSLG